MVPTVTAGTRLLDLIPLLEADQRLQVIFTVPGTHRWHGTDDFIRRHGGVVLPWQQALCHHWDLVLSASHRHIEEIHGPLLLLPHGAGALKSRSRSLKAGTPTQDTTGLDRELLTYRGRVVPAAVAVATERERQAIHQLCPEALCAAVVAGDLCLDRMAISRPLRRRYRQALRVGDDHELVTLSSTWSSHALFGRHPELYLQVLEEIGRRRIRVAAVLHPNIWAIHGTWQIRAWLAPALRRGLAVIPADEGWQATILASDYVIGDHGSTTSYAAATGIPVCRISTPGHTLRTGSIADAVARITAPLATEQPLLPQLRAASRHDQDQELVGFITDRQGRAAQILRTTMYRLLSLEEPSWPPLLPPVPVPVPLSGTVQA